MPKIRVQNSMKYVPYAPSFQCPSKAQRLAAAGKNPPSWCLNDELFSPIPKCLSIDDWLAQYAESGQTLRNFIYQNPWLCKRKHRIYKGEFNASGNNMSSKYPDGVVYMLPLGDMDPSFVESLCDYAEIFLSIPVKVLTGARLIRNEKKCLVEFYDKDLDVWISHKVQSRYHFSSNRIQLKVDYTTNGLLNLINKNCFPENAICVVALTTFDLYMSPSDLFIAGLASGVKSVAVFSTFRYKPELAFDKGDWYKVEYEDNFSDEEKAAVLFERCCRLFVHETSHLLGFDHCIFYKCCMNGSGHLEEDFRQPHSLCSIDLLKLQKLTGCNLIERHRSLLKFYRKHKFENVIDNLEKELTEFIKCN